MAEAGVGRAPRGGRAAPGPWAPAGSLAPTRPVGPGVRERGWSGRCGARLLPELRPHLGAAAISARSEPRWSRLPGSSANSAPCQACPGEHQRAPGGQGAPALSLVASPPRGRPWMLALPPPPRGHAARVLLPPGAWPSAAPAPLEPALSPLRAASAACCRVAGGRPGGGLLEGQEAELGDSTVGLCTWGSGG